MKILFYLIGAIAVFYGVFSIAYPTMAWNVKRMFVRSRGMATADSVDKRSLVITRVQGLIFIVFGIVFIVFNYNSHKRWDKFGKGLDGPFRIKNAQQDAPADATKLRR